MSGNDYNMDFDDEFGDDKFRDFYTFTYRELDDDRNIQVRRSFEDGSTWPVVLQEFLNFLNGVYGYDVSSKVRIEANPFGIEGRWAGGTYDADEHPLAHWRKKQREEEAEIFPEANETFTDDDEDSTS